MQDTELDQPRATYEIGGRRFGSSAPDLAHALAHAHAARVRPRCLCRPEGVEMYVARLGGKYTTHVVKRMPDTGNHHAPDCPSFEPPADCSGLGQLLGSAIKEDPATGETTLRLDFPLMKIPGRMPPTPGAGSDSVATDGTRLSLRGLLHFLWDQAGLTRWHPGFAGKRTWGTVRRHLLRAADLVRTARGPLLQTLYVPEPFFVDDRDAINARRQERWKRAAASPGKAQHLMLLIGEVKAIVPAKYGYKALIKHLPDTSFAIDDALFRRMGPRFEDELAIWSATDDMHLVIVATFSISGAGAPRLVELCLMPVTREWLPVADDLEKRLVEKLIREERRFIKGLRYNMDAGQPTACAVLTDRCSGPTALFIEANGYGDSGDRSPLADAASGTAWSWRPSIESIPPLPTAGTIEPGRSEAIQTVGL